MRRSLTLILAFLFPTWLISWILNLLGHEVSGSARIGFSIISLSGKLTLRERARIRHSNVIHVNSLFIDKEGHIGRLNTLRGPLDIELAKQAAIGNGNKIYRAPAPVSYGSAILKLGVLSKITGNHRLDCMRSIVIGDYSTVAGHDTQVWTHAYYHDQEGPGRFRVDGEVIIGNNVNIGSRCVIMGGVTIANAVVVGANSCVSKSLLVTGIYVNQPLRLIDSPQGSAMSKFRKVDGVDVCEIVYERKADV
jgi:acetyltransferase-like isoleucine patch superfamily enzyme